MICNVLIQYWTFNDQFLHVAITSLRTGIKYGYKNINVKNKFFLSGFLNLVMCILCIFLFISGKINGAIVITNLFCN